MAGVADARILELPKIEDPRGSLTFIEAGSHVPFAIERLYWIYDVPGGATRGGHAYKTLQEFLVALSGSFTVVVDDGAIRREFLLNRSYFGLFLPPGLWRTLRDFSTNSVCLVLASKIFDEGDYIRDYERFRAEFGPNPDQHS